MQKQIQKRHSQFKFLLFFTTVFLSVNTVSCCCCAVSVRGGGLGFIGLGLYITPLPIFHAASWFQYICYQRNNLSKTRKCAMTLMVSLSLAMLWKGTPCLPEFYKIHKFCKILNNICKNNALLCKNLIELCKSPTKYIFVSSKKALHFSCTWFLSRCPSPI